jgi:predicted component of type VI protein secretion system
MSPTQIETVNERRFNLVDDLFDKFMAQTEKYYKGSVDVTTYKGNCAGMALAINWKKMKMDEQREIRDRMIGKVSRDQFGKLIKHEE